jgi:hypothetical protein
MTNSPDLRPGDLSSIPLEELPEPLLPGKLWDPDPYDLAHHDQAEPSYESLVGAALVASAAVLLAKIVGIIVMANFLGATTLLRLWGGFFPYVAIVPQPVSDFPTIVTTSTIFMAFVAVTLMLAPVVRPQHWDRLRIWGRAVGLGIVLNTFILEILRDARWGDVVDWNLAWIVPMELAVGGAMLALALKKPRFVVDKDKEPPYQADSSAEETQ